MVLLTLHEVPTGTVLLVTTTKYRFISFPIVLATSRTYLKSALPSSSWGVPTAQKMISTSFKTSDKSVVKCNRPAFILRNTILSRPGS